MNRWLTISIGIPACTLHPLILISMVFIILMHHIHVYTYTDPYVSVVLYYENNKQAKWTSTVQNHSLTATFNESFSFNIAKMEVHHIHLHFNIKDHQT